MPGDVSLTGIEFTIKGSADKASASIDKLIGNLTQLNTALSNSANLAKASTGLKSLGDALKGIGGLKALTASMALRELGNAAKSLDGFKSAASAIKSITKVAENPEALANAANWLSEISHIDFTNIEVAAQGIKDIAASTRSIGNIKPVNEEIKRTGEAAKKANKPLDNFVKSLGRIAFYRIIRGIIKSITEAFSEGLKNAYEFSKLTGGALSQALDTISTKTLTMKNQLGAAFGGLLTAITPAILTAINIITKLAAAITRLIAILGGNSQWMRAKDVWTEWGEEASAAGGAAKEALRYLAPFDELNRLPSENKGGGGGANDPAYGDMFEWVSVEEGAGLADALKNAFDGVSEFFGSKDWAALADQAWEKLKEGFSDTGKATEVIRSMFRALGTLIGAGSAFVGEFCRNIVENIMEKFRANLVDYNGDGKISVGEFLKAVFLTAKDIAKEIRDWVKTNIVDPFMEGYADGIGLADKSEIYSAVTNFGIDLLNKFNQKVINPIIKAWNNFVDKMPNWLREMIESVAGGDLKIPLIGEISHIEYDGMTDAERTIKNGILRANKMLDKVPSSQKGVDVSGKLKSITDKLKADAKTISGVNANVTSAKDNIPAKSKTITGAVARFDKAESKLTVAQRTFKSKALFNSRERTEDFKKKWQVFDATANFYTRTRTQKFKDTWQVFDAIANFYTRTRTQKFKDEYQVFDAIARFYTRERTQKFKDSYQTFDSSANFVSRAIGNAFSTIFDSKANFNSRDNNLTTAQSTFDAVANFIDKAIGISTWFDAVAYFTTYRVDSNVSDGTNMKIDATANIVKTSGNIKGSVAFQEYAALGGAFYGGSWHGIPQYAGGTANAHGSLFVAGEAGPEVVGHIGGRTEVLNKSQIASAIYSATRSAMSNASMDNGVSEETMYRAFSRALADSDLGGDIELDGDTLYRAMVNRNRANTRLTGVNAMA